jgi:hypothetical protein
MLYDLSKAFGMTEPNDNPGLAQGEGRRRNDP